MAYFFTGDSSFSSFVYSTKNERFFIVILPRNIRKRAFRKGLDVTFEQVVEAYKPMIVSIMKKLHVTNEWDEYYQIGLIALWEASQQFDREKGSFSSFAYKKMYWAMVSHLRKQLRTKECALTDEMMHMLPALVPNEDRMVVEDLLNELTERQRKWVVGYVLEQKSLKTIAEEEGVPIGTVKQWRVSALKKLRSIPSERFGGN